jgi:hypothetical protein
MESVIRKADERRVAKNRVAEIGASKIATLKSDIGKIAPTE